MIRIEKKLNLKTFTSLWFHSKTSYIFFNAKAEFQIGVSNSNKSSCKQAEKKHRAKINKKSLVNLMIFLFLSLEISILRQKTLKNIFYKNTQSKAKTSKKTIFLKLRNERRNSGYKIIKQSCDLTTYFWWPPKCWKTERAVISYIR